MCNVDCFKWLSRHITEEEVKGKRVIEVGSYDINGSLRYVLELLKPSEYVGTDIKEGPCVDVICSAENLVKKFGKESFDIVLSTNTLEHIKDWKTAASNIKNICKTDGIILIIVPSSWPFHEYPHDFWRYSKEDLRDIFSDCDILELDEDAYSQSLAYTKIRKPADFNEKDLTLFKLHSVVTNRRESEIHDKDFRTPYYRMLILKNKTKGILRQVGRSIF